MVTVGADRACSDRCRTGQALSSGERDNVHKRRDHLGSGVYKGAAFM